MAMTEEEYLLVCTSEEACEVATEVTNLAALCQRHSQSDRNSNPNYLRKERECVVTLVAEINDLVGCLELLIEREVLVCEFYDRIAIDTYKNNLSKTTDEEIYKDTKIDRSLPVLVLKCLDIQKSVSKMLRFGINHIHPVKNTTGKQVLCGLINEFVATVEHINSECLPLEGLFDRNAIMLKKAKVKKYMNISIEDGVVLKKETT